MKILFIYRDTFDNRIKEKLSEMWPNNEIVITRENDYPDKKSISHLFHNFGYELIIGTEGMEDFLRMYNYKGKTRLRDISIFTNDVDLKSI